MAVRPRRSATRGTSGRVILSISMLLLGLTLAVVAIGLRRPVVPSVRVMLTDIAKPSVTISLLEPPDLRPASPPAEKRPSAVLEDHPPIQPPLLPAPGRSTAELTSPEHPRLHPSHRDLSPEHIEGEPRIAIVLDDMGLDRIRGARAVQLPAAITFSYMTYAEDLASQSAAARAHGHEVMLHIPMQPIGKQDPGPNALNVDLSDSELTRRLDWDLGRLDGIAGVNNHMGSRFTQWPHGMALVIARLAARGLFFLDSRTTPHTVAYQIAEATGAARAQRDIFLDDDIAAPAVATMLAETETVARRQGSAIAIGHPHDATLTALEQWVDGVEARGFRLVPISAVVARDQVAEAKSATIARK